MTDVPCVNPPHDPDDPQGHLNAIEAILNRHGFDAAPV
jgi:hypothetical protein